MAHKPIVIVGGGFGGVYTAKYLLEAGHRVSLVSKTNYFTFTPLLHEVATGSLISHDIVFEYESFFRNGMLDFVRGEMTEVDPEARHIIVNGEKIAYEYLVLAMGALRNPWKIKGSDYALDLKTAEDAVKLKRAIISRAQSEEKHVRVTVIGGGPTGLELLFDTARLPCTLKKKDPKLKTELRLVHSKKTLGGIDDPRVQDYIKGLIKKCKIDVVYEAYAEEITETSCTTTKGHFDSDITVLCAGVVPNTKMLKGILALDEKGHIPVHDTLQVVDQERIFALGDLISIDGKPVPKLAQTAVREAKVLAKNLLRLHDKKSLVSYKPETLGMLLSLGYGKGVGLVSGVVVRGVLAWYIWRTVYLTKTPGWGNKLRVAFTWTLGLFQGRNITEL